jgi:hypothetical protein
MAHVYKQFTAQDKALIPFNAHKQYDFTSASATSNSITHFSGRFTSESYDTYSGNSGSNDFINTIKYNQIDKLYYRNYLSQIHDKLGPIEFIKQPRNLYEKVNILSIPMGLYGNEIKPGSFYLSASKYDIIDDKFGNLLISGTLVNDYPNNIQENVFRLDPIKGFKKYDLGVHEGYATISEEAFGLTKEIIEMGITGMASLPDYKKTYQKNKWRRGTRIDFNAPTTYTTGQRKPIAIYPLDKDDSYFMNQIHYTNVTFNTSSLGSTSHKFPKITFNSTTGSLISSSHSEKFNFDDTNDFSISFWINPKHITTSGSVGSSTIENGFIIGNYVKQLVDSKKRYVISKSRTKNVHSHHIKDFTTPSHLGNFTMIYHSKIAQAENRFPYEIYMQSSSLFFDMSDGNTVKSITTPINGLYNNNFKPKHIICQNSGSTMQLYLDGILQSSTTVSFKNTVKNTADLYIGSSGDIVFDKSGGIGSSSIQNGFVIGNYVNSSSNFYRGFNGDLNNINIWSRAYNGTAITNISQSINGSPYIGNIFYQNGFASITHPTYHSTLNSVGINNLAISSSNNKTTFKVSKNSVDGINTLQFQGTHLIYEHEYQCTSEEHEFNNTTNRSARKRKSEDSYELADFTTSSLFKPHVTTIGLYNSNLELLVVGKLGQPVRMSDETDTTFVLRWDT